MKNENNRSDEKKPLLSNHRNSGKYSHTEFDWLPKEKKNDNASNQSNSEYKEYFKFIKPTQKKQEKMEVEKIINSESKNKKNKKKIGQIDIGKSAINKTKNIGLKQEEVVAVSQFKDINEPLKAIIKEFNQGTPEDSVITRSPFRGRTAERVPNGKLLFFTYNNTTPFVVGPTNDAIAPRLYLNFMKRNTVKIAGAYDQTERKITVNGRSIINIPPGSYGLAQLNNLPVILSEGYHVIHSANFQFNPAQDVVKTSKRFIQHGNKYILTVPNGDFAKVIIDNKPILIESRPEPYFFQSNNFVFDERTDFVKIADTYINHINQHIIRVPIGCMAKIINNNKAILLPYRKEPYVFDSNNFQFDPKKDIVNVSKPYIQHQNYHIIRVPIGKIAKVWRDNKAELLEYQEEPYEFNSNNFQLEGFVNANDVYIKHGNHHRIRVPVNRKAKIWDENEAKLLDYQKEPYVFNTPNLTFDDKYDLEQASAPCISHGTKHLVNVPAGKLALVFVNNKAMILESQEKTYEFNTPLFELVKNKDRSLFYDATTKLIKHGNLKRLFIHENEAAITWNNGALDIKYSSSQNIDNKQDGLKGEVILIKSSKHEVPDDCFISTGIEDIIYPPPDKEADIVTSSDMVKISMRLLVTFRIKNVNQAILAKKSFKGIFDHIIKRTETDMTNLTGQMQFLNALKMREYADPTDEEIKELVKDDSPSAPKTTLLTQIKDKLVSELEEIGVELRILSFKDFAYVSSEHLEQLQKSTRQVIETVTALSNLKNKTNLEVSNAERELKIAKIKQQQELEVSKIDQEKQTLVVTKQAERKAEQRQIEQKTTNEIEMAKVDNQNTILEKKTNANANATIKNAEAKKKATDIETDAKANQISKIQQAELDALERKNKIELNRYQHELNILGKALDEHPGLLKLKMMEVAYQNLAKVFGNSTQILSTQDVNPLMSNFLQGPGLFNLPTNLPGFTQQQNLNGQQLRLVSNSRDNSNNNANNNNSSTQGGNTENNISSMQNQ